jgi:ankyrin repeat protein
LLTRRSSVRNTERNSELLSSKLDHLTVAISRLLRLAPHFDSTANTACTNNVEDWVSCAESLVSSSTTLVEIPGSAENDKFKLVQEWIREQDDASYDDASDTELMPHWIKRASETFNARDYKTAAPFLEKIVQKTHDPESEGKDEMMRMLGEAYCRTGNWPQAGVVFAEQFDGRDELMERLAKEFFAQGKSHCAWNICQEKFDGRSEIMEQLATSYLDRREWRDAKRVLLELLKEGEESDQLRSMHTLAEICLALREIKDAKKWCVRVKDRRKVLLGSEDHLYYQSVSLLAVISLEDGDIANAEGYKALLPPVYHGDSSFERPNKECFEIEQLFRMEPKAAAKRISQPFLKTLLSPKSDKAKAVRHNIEKTGKVAGSGHGWALIHACAEHGRDMAIQLLLSKDPNNLDAQDKQGKTPTPLIVSAMYGHNSTVKLLLDKGADINATYEGHTALIEATLCDNRSTVELLLDRGANAEAKDKNGNTALKIATVNEFAGIVQLLLKRKADIEVVDNNGNTPLISAARRNLAEMVVLLVGNGANVWAKDRNGSTALDLHRVNERVRTVGTHATSISMLLEREMEHQRGTRKRSSRRSTADSQEGVAYIIRVGTKR